jgi:arylsulfatase A-like enzyme
MPDPDQNIVFLSIEDLNDWIEPLGGHPDTNTPNMQRLADRAALFTAAYAPAPACSPSRTAALFGKHPWETGVYANQQHWPDHFAGRQDLSIIGRFKSAGYKTIGAGKVFHGKQHDETYSCWDEFLPLDQQTPTAVSQAIKLKKMAAKNDFGPSPENIEPFDQEATNFIIDRMKAGATGQFWALGLYRPHLPFIVPQRFFDAIPTQVANPPGLGLNEYDPQNKLLWARLPKAAKRMAKQWMKTGAILHETGEYFEFIRAYLASIHYADFLLGQVLDHMDDNDFWENTHLILWSDHGWQLGEKLTFRKFSLWERALRVPLMIAGPSITPKKIDTPVSLVDLAPTLLNLVGLDSDQTLSGYDILAKNTRTYACSTWGIHQNTDNIKSAITVRSQTHRLIMYWDQQMELYDHCVDPFEHNNLLFEPSQKDLETYEPILSELLDQLPQTYAEPARTLSHIDQHETK